jgi:hypothetical protein
MCFDLSGTDEPGAPVDHDWNRQGFVPFRGTWYHRIEATRQIVETSVLIVLADEWDGWRESKDPTWRPIGFAGLVIALKALC